MLRQQLNAIAPARNKASDGTIGDARHVAEGGASDHNPHPYAGREWVAALDVTTDPRNGMSGEWLATSLFLARDPRVKYIIWDNAICEALGMNPWRWMPYTGTDPHTSHVHISVLLNQDSTMREDAWLLPVFQTFEGKPLLHMDATAPPRMSVKVLQTVLRDPTVMVDGVFGPITNTAVRKYQVQCGLLVDGIVGLHTWTSLRYTY